VYNYDVDDNGCRLRALNAGDLDFNFESVWGPTSSYVCVGGDCTDNACVVFAAAFIFCMSMLLTAAWVLRINANCKCARRLRARAMITLHAATYPTVCLSMYLVACCSRCERAGS
jgi:hypothetical protein